MQVIWTPTELGSKLHKDDGAKEVDNTYFKQIVSSLMYLTSTKLDIMYAISLISRHMEKSSKVHLRATRRVLRYVKGTTDYVVFFKNKYGANLVAYTDSDYVGDINDRKSTLGNMFMLNSSAISWTSKKQQIMILSTIEAEFVAATSSLCQALWLRKMFEVLEEEQNDPTIIYCDNM